MPIKILNVISDTNIGGAGRVLLTYLKNRNKTRFELVVALPTASALIPAIKALGVTAIEIEGLAEQTFSYSGLLGLRRTIKTIKPDIVHTHASLSARIAAKFCRGVKVIYTRHTAYPNKLTMTRTPVRQIIGFANNFLSDRIIAVSPTALENMVEAGVSPRKVDIIFNGTDKIIKPDENERTAIRSIYNINESDFLCGIFARLVPIKGHDIILDAAKLLRDLPNVKIIIAGSGELEKTIKDRIERDRLGNVVFTGFIENPETLMASLDVQLNASSTEATSISLLEGMSVGIPSIVSNCGGNPYVISDRLNGLILGERDGVSLANAIRTLYEDKQLYNELAKNAEIVFNDRFTAEIMAHRIEEVYINVFGGDQ
ncbi:MAG: glycosyltransferase [Defluviitaleaceae bacterium]|nr:glycosyltransferase [Defluviitaleaceae bacterium]